MAHGRSKDGVNGPSLLFGAPSIGAWSGNPAGRSANDHLDETLLAFTHRMIALRRDHPVLRRRHWFQGVPIRGSID